MNNLVSLTELIVKGLVTDSDSVSVKEFESDEECDKISVVFSMEHKAGALYELVRHLAENQINMMKIESRPMQTGVWKYFLYVDFEGNISDEKVKKALNKLDENSSYFKLVGGYKKAE